VVHHTAFQRAGRGKVEFGIHAQGQQMGRQRGQLPEVPVAQAAVGVQAHLDDARVQALVQKVAQVHQQAHQHTPVHAGRRGQRDRR
jgi:hypothetical protein